MHDITTNIMFLKKLQGGHHVASASPIFVRKTECSKHKGQWLTSILKLTHTYSSGAKVSRASEKKKRKIGRRLSSVHRRRLALRQHGGLAHGVHPVLETSAVHQNSVVSQSPQKRCSDLRPPTGQAVHHNGGPLESITLVASSINHIGAPHYQSN